MEEKIKIKALMKHQIIISLDRLTRFKSTEDKYLRVFKDIITSNLISPKFKKHQLDVMDYKELSQLVANIFNYSLECLNIELSKDFSINKKLLQYEKSVFKFDENVAKLLENKLNYKSALNLIEGEDLPLNLKWLKSLSENGNQVKYRGEYGVKFPLEKIVLVEGITEEILLPEFAKICGVDFDKVGIKLISAGGKNQVVKLFYQFADTLKLPMFVLLDNDAKENLEEISPKLRSDDKVHLLECGEFEDILPLNLLKRALNHLLRNYSSVSIADLRKDLSMTKILEEIFKERGMEFKKAEFAYLVRESILGINDITEEIKMVVTDLR